MNPKSRAGFLFRLYRKRTSSLFLNMYTSGITGSEDDIHKTRTDVKKLQALYSFLEIASKGKFRKERYNKAFRNLFRQAGRLREMHINLMILSQYGSATDDEKDFFVFLKRKEKIHEKKFLAAVRDFDDEVIISNENELRKFMEEMHPAKFSVTVEKFINKKCERILRTIPEIHHTESLHEIRKDLKTISAILEVCQKCVPSTDEAMVNFYAEIIHLEEMIGIWHDNSVFLDVVEGYRELKYADAADQEPAFGALLAKLKLENKELVVRLESMMVSVNFRLFRHISLSS